MSVLGGLSAALLVTSCVSPGADPADPAAAAAVTSAAPDVAVRVSDDAAQERGKAGPSPGKPAPPPGGPGDITVPVKVDPQPRKTPVAPGREVVISDTVTVGVDVSTTEVRARAPGEIGGDAVHVIAKVTNTGPAAIDVSQVAVTVEGRTGAPLSPLYGDPYAPLTGELNPDSTGQASFVFTLDDTVKQPLTIVVSYTAGNPAAVFQTTVR